MPNRDEETIELARRHYAIEIGLTDVFVLRDAAEAAVVQGSRAAGGNGDTIKLLEVNENTIPSGVVPIQFGPAPESGIHFSSVIIEVTPQEFQRIQASELPLPEGWEIGDRIAKPELAPNEHAG